MNRKSAWTGLLAAYAATFSFSAQAATRTTAIDPANSAMDVAAHACLQGLTYSVSTSENCMYDGGPSATSSFIPFGEPTGPYSQAQYYSTISNPDAYAGGYIAVPNDGKIRQVIEGSITIDDNGDGFGANDLISFELTMTSPDGGDIIRNLGTNLAEKYTSMTQTLTAAPVNSAMPNASGGFDYVIGSEGFPVRLTFTDATANGGVCVGEKFGDMECDAGFDDTTPNDPLRWEPWLPTDNGFYDAEREDPHVGPPQSPGLGSLENNLGARTIGTVTNYSCIDDGTKPTSSAPNTYCYSGKTSFAPLVTGPNDAPPFSGDQKGDGAEDVGWDQLLLKISTDASGNVLTAEGYDVQEYMIFGRPGYCGSDPAPPEPLAKQVCNTWLSGHFEIAGEPAATAVDDTAQPTSGTPLPIDVLANDTGFVDPVTVSFAGGSTTTGTTTESGTVVINGTNPGNQANIDITYTSALGYSGPDDFTYTVDDGITSSTATVTLDVLPTGANDDSATTHLNTTIAGIPIGANDSGLQDPVTVAIIVNPDQGGSVDAINGNGGPLEDVTVDFTPSAALGTATYNETFTYEVTDATMATDTAVVTVTVENRRPAAVAASESGAEGATVVTDISALPGVELGDPPSTITITANPANGTATPSGNVVSYTPSGFYTGSDSYDYTITDVDGETSAATVTLTIGPKLVPTANDDTADGDQDTTIIIDVTANDTAGSGPLSGHTVTISSPPATGSATVDSANVVRYTPPPEFSGTASFDYTLTDLDGDSSTATVTVTVSQTQVVVPLPSGSGIGPTGLLALAFVAWWRRRVAPARKP